MKIGVYFCACGDAIAARLDVARVRAQIERFPDVAWFREVGFLCDVEGRAAFEAHLRAERPDRVVVAACSPRDHEETFRRAMERAGMNPYLLQMANVREQVAWVTADCDAATRKASASIRAAVARVRSHEPLERIRLTQCADLLVIGAGPAGLKAALTAAEGGRKVTLVERGSALGGLPVRFEEVFPDLECGSCLVEPLLSEALHGKLADRIEILTLAQVESVVGFWGAFRATIRRRPRYVDLERCIGCGECFPPCPVSAPNDLDAGVGMRKAVAFAFQGNLPNVPLIDPSVCVRFKGEACTKCRDACPVEGTIRYDDAPSVVEREVGAIVLAVGAQLLDVSGLAHLGWGRIPDVRTSLEVERMIAANGPTGGALATSRGKPPERVAVVHCVGSLDPAHREYCSAVCCQGAVRFNRLLAQRLPKATVTHVFKTLCLPGKDAVRLYREAVGDSRTRFVHCPRISEVALSPTAGGGVELKAAGQDLGEGPFDLVVLCPAIVPSASTKGLARALDVPLDRHGFFAEAQGRIDPVSSKVRGIFLAGTCRGPMAVPEAVAQGIAAAGQALAGLAPGRVVDLEPTVAVVDEVRCSGCKACLAVCPFKAIAFDVASEVAKVNPVLCQGCGTCVSGCPSGSIRGNQFTDRQILSEIQELLA